MINHIIKQVITPLFIIYPTHTQNKHVVVHPGLMRSVGLAFAIVVGSAIVTSKPILSSRLAITVACHLAHFVVTF